MQRRAGARMMAVFSALAIFLACVSARTTFCLLRHAALRHFSAASCASMCSAEPQRHLCAPPERGDAGSAHDASAIRCSFNSTHTLPMFQL